MDITISGQGIDVTPAIRSYVENKLHKIPRIVPDVMDVHVKISVQKHLQIVDFGVKTRHDTFSAHASTTDMYASINEGVDNLLKQMRRARKKVQSVKGRRRMEINEMLPQSEDLEEEGHKGEVHIMREQMPVKPMSLEEAQLQLRGGDNDFILFRNSMTSELSLLYKRKDGNLGLIETNQ